MREYASENEFSMFFEFLSNFNGQLTTIN